MRISDWSSDVCSSDLSTSADRRNGEPGTIDGQAGLHRGIGPARAHGGAGGDREQHGERLDHRVQGRSRPVRPALSDRPGARDAPSHLRRGDRRRSRSEEHTSELQSLMRISYAVFCLKKKKKIIKTHTRNPYTVPEYGSVSTH